MMTLGFKGLIFYKKIDYAHVLCCVTGTHTWCSGTDICTLSSSSLGILPKKAVIQTDESNQVNTINTL